MKVFEEVLEEDFSVVFDFFVVEFHNQLFSKLFLDLILNTLYHPLLIHLLNPFINPLLIMLQIKTWKQHVYLVLTLTLPCAYFWVSIFLCFHLGHFFSSLKVLIGWSNWIVLWVVFFICWNIVFEDVLLEDVKVFVDWGFNHDIVQLPNGFLVYFHQINRISILWNPLNHSQLQLLLKLCLWNLKVQLIAKIYFEVIFLNDLHVSKDIF